MSSAYLASNRAHALHPDRVRIAALSVAISVNLAVFLAASRPLPPFALPHLTDADLGVRLIDPPRPQPLPPPPPPLDVQPLHRPSQALPSAVPLPGTPRISDQGNRPAPPVQQPTLQPPATTVTPTSVSIAPVEASLAYRAAPLSFPVAAARQHLHGTVLLRVLVDEQGKPIEVVIEQSSGHALLDRSAREQVLARWRFQPAAVDGRQVRAWARVPVTFELRDL